MVSTVEFTNKFLELFPKYQPRYVEHIDFNEELLPHVFFGDEVTGDLPSLITSGNEEEIRKFFDFLELMLVEGDDAVQNVIVVTLLEKIALNDERFNQALPYMSPESIKKSKEQRAFWHHLAELDKLGKLDKD